MTRADAILLIRYATCVMTGLNKGLARLMDTALDNIIAALRGSQPCPDTGIVSCGCGAIAKVRKSQAPHSGYYIVCQNINCICNVGFDRDTSGVPLGYFKTEEEAIKAWNTAMGYTAPPRPGAIGPDAGEMDPNGDEGATHE